VIWIYGICDRPDLPAPRRHGLAQAPLDAIREGDLTAVFTTHAESVGAPAPDALWVHERVVERLMTDRTVLPMRFGSTVEDEPALHALLTEHQTSFLVLLARVRGRVELGVRVLEAAPEPRDAALALAVAPSRSGTEYLLEKVENGRRIGDLCTGLDEPLSELAVESRRQPPRSAEEVLRASYLVERSAVGRFRSAVERLQRARPQLAFLCTGPWPPYSFMDGA
jgi:hypothetical protein